MGQKQITIVGGGITGLSTAFYLQRELQAQQIDAKIVVAEASPSFGGRIHTRERDGFIFEKGPDSFLARKVAITDLIRDLGLEDEVVGTNPYAKKNYILHKNRLYEMPEGMVMGIPSKIKPFITTDLVSFKGKMRAMLDFIKPAHKDSSDESLGHFMERRLGKEVLFKIAEPLLSGIYAGDTYKLSIQATFPQFAQMEREYGSLIRATMKSSKKPAVNLPGQAGKHKSVFISFRYGLKTLVQALVKTLEEMQVELKTERALTSLVKKSDEQGERYVLIYSNGDVEESDYVILTLPAHHAASLFPHTKIEQLLSSIDYVSVANIVLAYNREDIKHPLNGSGFTVPRTEKRFFTACTWTSEKWLHTSPRDKVLLRCYIGRAGAEEWVHMSDYEVIQKVRQDLLETMGIDAEPLFVEVTRLHQSMPQYDVGHLQKVEQIRKEIQSTMPHVWITGAAFHGVGVPDCVRQGKEAALHVAKQLQQSIGSSSL